MADGGVDRRPLRNETRPGRALLECTMIERSLQGDGDFAHNSRSALPTKLEERKVEAQVIPGMSTQIAVRLSGACE